MIEFAIVGVGSWGLSVLERTVSRARHTSKAIRVHVVQPGAVGGGVYTTGQPDYLVLNNPCGQLSLYAAADPGESPPYAVGLLDWANARGYRWVGDECRIDPAGKPIERTDYLPRRLMGEYLAWFYATMVSVAPPNLEVIHHDASATDIVADAGGREQVMLDDGTVLSVAHVILTSGHTWNDEPLDARRNVQYQRPYPVEYFDETTPPGAPIAIAGMGLVAFDLITSLTVGRGGAFEDAGPRRRYVRSGREPAIYLYSRSGVPYCVKSAHGVDPTGVYQPIVCTPEAFRALGGGVTANGTRGHIDFRADLLPLLFAEMQGRYHFHAAFLAGGEAEARSVSCRLRHGWADGSFAQVVASLEETHGRFDPGSHVFAGDERYASSRDYQAQVYRMVENDLDEALMPGGSPVKAALEVMRILRDQLRSVIEFGGLSLESYVDFQSNVRGRINRLEAGPPPLRSQQLLGLLDAGVVRVPFGPAPDVEVTADGRVAIRSTRLDRQHSATVTAVVRGHLDLPSLTRSASPLITRLYSKGRLTQLSYGDTSVGSVAISQDFHPYDVEGRLQRRLSLLGVLTEGVRYFTHYLPSPQSRLRAVLDAQACVESVVG